MDLNQLADVLVSAKISSYAKSSLPPDEIEDISPLAKKTVLPDGKKIFEFEQNGFRYLDNYSGFNPFKGKETVFFLGQPAWEMAYQGEVTDSDIEPKTVYEFLKKALRHVTIAKPFRGPSHFTEGEFEYFNKVEGDIKRFQGHETIRFNNQEVYQLDYYGGLLKNSL
ncbi:MAG: DUF5680 domain-containing protein [Patescibacteria group bacterium]|jgi:hypothetical protein